MDLEELMRQAQDMKAKIEQLQQEAAKTVVEGSAGGGMVSVRANGRAEIVSVKIDPEVLQSNDIEMLQDLIVAAGNQALNRAKEAVQSELGQIAGGMGLPPGMM